MNETERHAEAKDLYARYKAKGLSRVSNLGRIAEIERTRERNERQAGFYEALKAIVT